MSVLTINDNLDSPAEVAGNALTSVLKSSKPVLFLSSGGSSLSILAHINTDLLDESVTIGVLDERYSRDPSVNNYQQVLKTSFGQAAQETGSSFINSKPNPKENMVSFADRFESSIKRWIKNNPNGKVVATAGIGTDGHLAGIMPSKKKQVFSNRFQDNEIVKAYEVTPDVSEQTKRVTTTITFFRKYLDKVIVYAVGESKCPILDKLINENVPLHEMPSQVLRETGGDIFTDCELSGV